MQGIIQYAHHLLTTTIRSGETVIDATCGNGHDTLFLSKLVGNHGHVLAFDIQQQAIEATKQRLHEKNQENVTLIHDSHENINNYLDTSDAIGGAIFNLGYLPRSDKEIITKGETTIAALDVILHHLKINGIAVLVVYHGHKGGKHEKDAIIHYVTDLEQKQFNVLRYGYINQQNNPPFVIAIQKRS